MASTAQDKIAEVFWEIAGVRSNAATPIVDAGVELASEIRKVTEKISGPAPQAEKDGAGVLESVGLAVLQNAFGAAPLIRGIASLFTGGDEKEEVERLEKFRLPPSIHLTAANTPGGFREVDSGQRGELRVFGEESSGPVRASVPAQVTVNVQAMDARSFLDRSSEIAGAVREAMLHMNSINDVVGEL
jgi:hypothetical protein